MVKPSENEQAYQVNILPSIYDSGIVGFIKEM